jgi:hypothetical protein
MGDYVIEVVQTADNAIKTLRIRHIAGEMEEDD